VKDLIEALTILMKYGGTDTFAPTHCEHDMFSVAGIGVEKDAVSADDSKRLDELGFYWDDGYECWASSRFGSC
jgi:hypothetical protein